MTHINWTRRKMGQNHSTAFDDGPIRKDSPDQVSTWPPSPSITQEHTIPPTARVVKIEEGYSRPLPPPLNPVDVRRQMSELDEWTVIDDDGELMIANTMKKRKFSDWDRETLATTQEISKRSLVTSPDASEGIASDLLTPYGGPPKKRRFLVTEKARALTAINLLDDPAGNLLAEIQTSQGLPDQQLPDALNIGRAYDASTPLPRVFEESSVTSSDDLGDGDLVLDAEDKDASSFSSASNEDEELVKFHAKLHQKSMSKANAAAQELPFNRRLPLIGQDSDYAMAQKMRIEKYCIERSRWLREKRLAKSSGSLCEDVRVPIPGAEHPSDSLQSGHGQQSDAAVHDVSLVQGSGRYRESLSQRPHHAQHLSFPYSSDNPNLSKVRPLKYDTPDNSRISDEDIDTEALLDESEAYNRSKSDTQARPLRSRAKPSSNTLLFSGRNSLNPYSRTAAERWRTQSRYLDATKSLEFSTNRSRHSIEEGEARLRHFTQKLDARRPSAVDYVQSSCTVSHSNEHSQHHLLPFQEEGTYAEETLSLGEAREIDYNDAQQVLYEHERLKDQQRDLEGIKQTLWYIATLRSVGDLLDREEKELNEVRKFITHVLDKGLPGKPLRFRMGNIRQNMKKRIDRIDPEMLPEDENQVRELYYDLLGQDRAKTLEDTLEKLDDSIIELRIHRSRLQSSKKTARKRERTRAVRLQLNGHASAPARRPVTAPAGKKVRWADVEDENGRARSDLPDGTEIDLDGPSGPKPRPKKLNKTERDINALNDKLDLFRAGKSMNPTSTRGRHLEQAGKSNDSESEKSDEETNVGTFGTGSSFMSSKTFSCRDWSNKLDIEQDLDEINRLEDQRQRDEYQTAGLVTTDEHAPSQRQSSQLFDPELVLRMKEKTTKATRFIRTGVGGEEEEIEFADWTDNESIVSTDSDISDSSYNDTLEIYVYTVMGRFVGLPMYKDHDIIAFNKFKDRDKAEEHARKMLTSLSSAMMAQSDFNLDLHTRIRDGVQEQLLTLGVDGEIQAKVWTDRQIKVVDMGKAAMSKAKKKMLVGARDIYTVTWEKTTTTTTAQAANTSQVYADDDLFGPEPPPAPATTTTIEHCPAGDEQRFFDLAAANLQAKEDFMLWYSQFFPDKERKSCCITNRGKAVYSYSGMLRQVDNAHEDQLRRLGDIDIFEAEEEVEVKSSSADDGDEQGVKAASKTVKEKMKVFVRLDAMRGPVS